MVSEGDPAKGFYSVRPTPDLRVVAMNTVILGTEYGSEDGVSQEAAAEAQLTWFEAELGSLADGEKVLIAMHIPPGINAYEANCGHGGGDAAMWGKGAGDASRQDRFLTAVAGASEAVVGIAYGHTHLDELRRVHSGTDASSTVTEVAVAAPGITFNHHNNPSFKLVAYDGGSKELTDFVTLYTPKDAPAWGDGFFRFSEVFGCAEGATILSCVQGFESTDALAAKVEAIYLAGATHPGCASSAATVSKGVEVFFGQ